MDGVLAGSAAFPVKPRILHCDTGVTLLGGGEVMEEDLELAISFAPTLVCADGGANSALAFGRIPEWVVGDMDSVAPDVRVAVADRLIQMVDQDTTDFEKCLAFINAPLILCVGFTGLRLDHELAALSCLAGAREKRAVVLGGRDACFRAPREFRIDLPVGLTISLFPFNPVSAKSHGLHWPLDGLRLDMVGRCSTSNRTSAGRVEIHVDRGDLLVVLPKSSLSAVADALWARRC